MNQPGFNKLLAEILEKVQATLSKKGAEYTSQEDRLSNFKSAGVFLSCSPERALLGMWAKHLVSIKDLVADLENGKEAPLQFWEEKLLDSINYAILLWAVKYQQQ